MAAKRSKSTASAIEAKFAPLFWQARNAARGLGKDADATKPGLKSAVAFAKARKWPWAHSLLEAIILTFTDQSDEALKVLEACEKSVPRRWRALYHFIRGDALLENGKCDDAIKEFLQTLDDPDFDTPGYAWDILGTALSAKGEYNEAITAYRNALADPKYDRHGATWYNLGIVLADCGEQDEAIAAYRKALAEPNLETPGDAWYNLGIALADKGDDDAAIAAYRKSLEEPRRVTHGRVWNNLGVALAAKGEHEQAIEAYRKAIDDPKFDEPARTWVNLGHSYAEIGNRELAANTFEESLKIPDAQGGDHARARFQLQLLKSQIKTEALSPDDRAMADRASSGTATQEIESQIIGAIRNAGDTQYEKYLARLDSPRVDTLSILRGWSSAVTLLEGSERRWRGGGYFLKWRGHGIVIDPGFDFLRNFHDAQYHGREIGTVVVSHNHPDHNSDVKPIDDLRYELWKRLKETKQAGSEPYALIWDQDTNGATDFGIGKPAHQYEPILLVSGFPHPINLLHHASKIPLCITPFKVTHGNDVPHAMGMVVELLDEKGAAAVRIGYTADTAYFEDLHKQLRGCDVLIAHISQPSIEELQDASKLKDVHLGYRGTARLLTECKPKLALIGEFWAGFTDLRIALVKGLRERSGVAAILPTGLAMHVRLPSLEIECTECAKPTPFSEIKVAPPSVTFGSLAYLCPNCVIG